MTTLVVKSVSVRGGDGIALSIVTEDGDSIFVELTNTQVALIAEDLVKAMSRDILSRTRGYGTIVVKPEGSK